MIEILRSLGHSTVELRGYTLRQLNFWAAVAERRLRREASEQKNR